MFYELLMFHSKKFDDQDKCFWARYLWISYRNNLLMIILDYNTSRRKFSKADPDQTLKVNPEGLDGVCSGVRLSLIGTVDVCI